MNNFTDIQLWSLVQGGNTAAFAELYNRHWEKVYTHIYWRIYHRADAQDLVQELFVHLWEKRRQTAITDSVTGYLYAAARTRVLNYIKANGVRTLHLLQVARMGHSSAVPTLPDITHHIQAAELKKLYRQEVDRLPEKMKHIFLLSREQDLSIDQIAVHLSLSPQTVKNQLTTALKKIRAGLEHYHQLLSYVISYTCYFYFLPA